MGALCTFYSFCCKFKTALKSKSSKKNQKTSKVPTRSTIDGSIAKFECGLVCKHFRTLQKMGDGEEKEDGLNDFENYG